MNEARLKGNERSTLVRSLKDRIVVTYHDTDVVAVNTALNVATFDIGGHHTQTTARRINQACGTFNLPWSAHRENRKIVVVNEVTGRRIEKFPTTVFIGTEEAQEEAPVIEALEVHLADSADKIRTMSRVATFSDWIVCANADATTSTEVPF